MIQVADAMADILQATKPYSIETRQDLQPAPRLTLDVLEDVKLRVRSLAEKAGADVEVGKHAYPHFFYIDDKPADQNGWIAFDLSGDDVLDLSIASSPAMWKRSSLVKARIPA